MTKNENKKKVIKMEIIVFVLLLLALIFIWKGLGNQKKEVAISFEEGLEIIEIGSYSGAYMEDGSEEQVSDVMMIKVKNNSDQTLQYAEIVFELDDIDAEFAFSTLPPGEEVLVLEKSKLEYSRKCDDAKTELRNVVFFEEDVSLCEDIIKIYELEGALNIENISGKDIKGPVAVYYKTVQDDIYQGGITYRVFVEDGLKAGEIRQVMTKHFSLENSKIMFVTYVP